MSNMIFIIFIGIGATAIIDLWSLVRQQVLNIPALNIGLVGRWIAYMPSGKFHHHSITASAPIRGEHLIGWTAHYIIGISFAALLIAIGGVEWIHQPSLDVALIVGTGTVAVPFLFMQPAMGAGIAASKTPKPNLARLHGLITHTIFGLGLYLSGWGIKWIFPIG